MPLRNLFFTKLWITLAIFVGVCYSLVENKKQTPGIRESVFEISDIRKGAGTPIAEHRITRP